MVHLILVEVTSMVQLGVVPAKPIAATVKLAESSPLFFIVSKVVLPAEISAKPAAIFELA